MASGIHGANLISHTKFVPPPPPPPPPPRKEVDNAVRQPNLHAGKSDAPPPERYVQHEVQKNENLTEIAHRYQTSTPMLEAANPQLNNPDALEIGQKLNVPIGANYGTEPTRDVLEPGQTLTDMAREHPNVSARDIARANRSNVPNSNRVQAGQELWVPAQKDASPLEQKVQATDQAQASLDHAQQRYDSLPPDAHPAVREDAHHSVQTAQGNLNQAVREELDLRAKNATPPEGAWSNDEERYAAAGAQLKERYQADAGATKQLDTALQTLANERYRASPAGQAEEIVTQATAAGKSPEQQMQELSKRLADAPPEVKSAVAASPKGQQMLQDAANWATEPLAGGDAQQAERDHGTPLAAGIQSAERLEQVTRGLPPDMAAQLTGKAMPTIEAFSGSFKEHYPTLHSPFKDDGFQNLMKAMDRGIDTPQGQINMQKLAAQDVWDRTAMHQHIAEGGRPAYALEWAKQQGVDIDAVKQDIRSAMKTYASSIDQTGKAYAEHMSELGWLVANHGGAMTPEQLEQAIAQYAKEKGPEWEAKGNELKARLVAHGEKLAGQIADLDPEGGGAEIAKEILSNPSARLAFSSAVQSNPELLAGAQGEKVANFFSNPGVQAKLGDQGRKLANELATIYAKRVVLDKVRNLDPSDAASVATVKQALTGLKDSRFAKLLGLSSSQMDEVVSALENTIPKAGESADDIAKRTSALNIKLKDIKGLNGSTAAGRLIRGLGVALSGVSFLASTGKAINDPTVKNGLQAIVGAAGLGQRGSELLVAIGKVDADSALGKLGGKTAGKVVGALGAVFDVWNMCESFASGDIPSGVLYGTGAAGGLMATFGAGSMAGPIGIGLVLVSVIGLGIWDSVKEANKHEPGSDGGTSLRFLQNAGISEAAARELVNQNGKGHSPVPLLLRYAEHKGLDMQKPEDQKKFVDWLNHMPHDKLVNLRDRLHQTLDYNGGNMEKFPAAKEGDDRWKPVQKVPTGGPGYGTMDVNMPPSSAAQMDKVLTHLGLPVLTP